MCNVIHLICWLVHFMDNISQMKPSGKNTLGNKAAEKVDGHIADNGSETCLLLLSSGAENSHFRGHGWRTGG